MLGVRSIRLGSIDFLFLVTVHCVLFFSGKINLFTVICYSCWRGDSVEMEVREVVETDEVVMEDMDEVGEACERVFEVGELVEFWAGPEGVQNGQRGTCICERNTWSGVVWH